MATLTLHRIILTTRVVGTVTGKEYAYRGECEEPVTLYTVREEDGTEHRGVVRGHLSPLNLGDEVEARLESYPQKESVGLVEQPSSWRSIESYRILEKGEGLEAKV